MPHKNHLGIFALLSDLLHIYLNLIKFDFQFLQPSAKIKLRNLISDTVNHDKQS